MPDFKTISLEEVMAMITDAITGFFERFPIVYIIVPLFVLTVGVYYLIRGLFGKFRRNLEDNVFLVFCVSIILLSATALLSAQFGNDGFVSILSLIAYLFFSAHPAIFCLHTWTQVSHRPITGSTLILYFSVPVILWGVKIYQYFVLEMRFDVWDFYILKPTSIDIFVLVVYWVCMIVKSFLLCFNVYYQMPRHMRSTSRPILLSAIILIACFLFSYAVNTREDLMVFMIGLAFILNRCFFAFFLASAANVIATSREFVFANLSTMILVLSKKERILEWNSKGEDKPIFALVQPKYLQSFDEYKKRLLEIGNGVVSPHDENIITVTVEGKEYHMLITKRAIREGNKQYGNLIEISEVTDIYSVLRYMESIAAIDQMTGLYNRNAYLQMARRLAVADKLPLTIIVGDVNYLKRINDQIGHLSGDRLLTCISENIRMNAPREAFIARIGGDEVVLLVPNSDERTALAFVDAFNRSVSGIYDAEFGTPSVSWGWSVLRSTSEDYNETFQRADKEMYAKKKAMKESEAFLPSGLLPYQDDRI